MIGERAWYAMKIPTGCAVGQTRKAHTRAPSEPRQDAIEEDITGASALRTDFDPDRGRISAACGHGR